MSKTKAEMAETIKRLEEQRRLQYRAIREWEEKHNDLVQLRDERAQQLQAAGARINELAQRVSELEQEVNTRKSNEVGVQRRYDMERNEHAKTQRSRYEKIQRISVLEKLLVHNGKAIGALSDLAAEKYKNDDLPF